MPKKGKEPAGGGAKRIRAPDYTAEETAIIRTLFVEHNKTLTSKHSNDVTQKNKDAIYKDIHGRVNACGVSVRSLQSIKDKWQTLKKGVKEKVAAATKEYRQESVKTGRGGDGAPPPPNPEDSLDDEEKEILSVIPPETVSGVPGGFASDEPMIDFQVIDNYSDSESDTELSGKRERSSSCPPDVTPVKKNRVESEKPIKRKETPRAGTSSGKGKVVASSDYYRQMIKIETEKKDIEQEKLDQMKRMYNLKKWYMEEKLKLLLSIQQTQAAPLVSQKGYTTLMPMETSSNW